MNIRITFEYWAAERTISMKFVPTYYRIQFVLTLDLPFHGIFDLKNCNFKTWLNFLKAKSLAWPTTLRTRSNVLGFFKLFWSMFQIILCLSLRIIWWTNLFFIRGWASAMLGKLNRAHRMVGSNFTWNLFGRSYKLSEA